MKQTLTESFVLNPIGFVKSELKTLEDCPLQESEGAPEAWIEIKNEFAEGLDGVEVGSKLVLLTWFHEAQRNLLKQYRRRETESKPTGVFTIRSPHRPNPIGIHHVDVVEVRGSRIRVSALEVLDGTPIVDIKPSLG